MTARKEAQRTKKHDRSQGLYNRMAAALGLLHGLALRGEVDGNGWNAIKNGKGWLELVKGSGVDDIPDANANIGRRNGHHPADVSQRFDV